jgi:hypothetical protein
MLSVTRFESDILRMKRIVFMILISFSWRNLLSSSSTYARVDQLQLFCCLAIGRDSIWLFLNCRLRTASLYWANSVLHLLNHNLLIILTLNTRSIHGHVIDGIRSSHRLISLTSRGSRLFHYHLLVVKFLNRCNALFVKILVLIEAALGV